MRPGLSLYLDLLRVLAAATVFLSHLSWAKLSGGVLWQIQRFGHDGVIVFFVLSGFVIQHVVTHKEATLGGYAIARLARLYSVVLPALLLTALCDSIGMALRSEIYAMDQQAEPGFRLAAAAVFLSQSWGWGLDLLSNNAFWSLPYEFWYYQIFGAFVFLRGRQCVFWVGVGCLVAGPKILVYLPVWLAGVIAYQASERRQLGRRRANWLFALSAMALLLVVGMEALGLIVRDASPWLPQSFSPVDFITAGAVALNLYAAAFIELPLRRLEIPIAALAGYTFSLYLFHLPLLHLLAAFLPDTLPTVPRAALMAAGVIGMVWLIGRCTEHKKGVLAGWLATLAGLLKRRGAQS